MATAKADARKTERDTVVLEAVVDTKAGDADAAAEVSLSAVRTPLYAYVGAADFAVEKLKGLPSTYLRRVQEMQERVQEFQQQVKSAQDSAREQAKARREAVREQLTTLPGRAREVYRDFVVRGKKLVESIRSNPNTKAAADEAKAAVAEARDAVAHVRRSAKAAERAGEEAAESIG